MTIDSYINKKSGSLVAVFKKLNLVKGRAKIQNADNKSVDKKRS